MMQGKIYTNSNKMMRKKVSMNSSNVKYIKNIDYFLIENQMETNYEYDDENPLTHSEGGQYKSLKKH